MALSPALAAFAPIRNRLLESLEDLAERSGVDRADYLLDDGLNYLNHASIGTVPRVVHEAQVGYLRICETNPWLHVWSRGFSEEFAATRALAAEFLGVQERNVALTRGTTEIFNAFAQGVPLGDEDEVLWSEYNHAGARVCWEHQAEVRGFSVREFALPIEDVASLSVEDVVQAHVAACSERTRVLVLPHIDNVIGIVHPIREIAEAVRRVGVKFVLVDGAQTVGAMPLDLDDLGCDGYATSSHKWVQSPKGLGLGYVSDSLLQVLRPMIVTWGKQRWAGTARSLEDYGTRDYSTILSLGDALRFSESRGIEDSHLHLMQLQKTAFEFVDAEPSLRWMSPRRSGLRGTLWSVRRAEHASPNLAEKLFEDHRIVVRGHRNEHDCVRFSPGYATTESELLQALERLARA